MLRQVLCCLYAVATCASYGPCYSALLLLLLEHRLHPTPVHGDLALAVLNLPLVHKHAQLAQTVWGKQGGQLRLQRMGGQHRASTLLWLLESSQPV